MQILTHYVLKILGHVQDLYFKGISRKVFEDNGCRTIYIKPKFTEMIGNTIYKFYANKKIIDIHSRRQMQPQNKL